MERMLAGLLLTVVATACVATPVRQGSEFVGVEGTCLLRDGRPYHFVGANMWYGANLAAPAPGGDRDRLLRELDLLQSLGVDNLRVLGISEGRGGPNTVQPTLEPEPERFDERLLDGLDFMLAEMAKRDMVAVLYLTNYWEWSGGMAQRQSWQSGEPVPNPFFERFSWPQFMAFSARFYANPEANAAFRRSLARLIGRENRYTGIRYRDDPTIMAWQLANEPRPGNDGTDPRSLRAFERWVRETAAFIRSLDSNHLISTGSEGLVGSLGSAELYRRVHHSRHIDYLTVHLWVLNWSWYEPTQPDATYPGAERMALDYLDRHVELAAQLGKPLVLEEFGIPRDQHAYDPSAPTSIRDRFYSTVLGHIRANSAVGGPFAGSNFWAWGGYGRPRDPEEPAWRSGDDLTGDPPQEPQGRNSVFASDESTLTVLREQAAAVRRGF